MDGEGEDSRSCPHITSIYPQREAGQWPNPTINLDAREIPVEGIHASPIKLKWRLLSNALIPFVHQSKFKPHCCHRQLHQQLLYLDSFTD